MRNILVIAVGAAVGANLRYALSLWAQRQWGEAFPYGTLLINVLGSFLIGLLLGAGTARFRWGETARLMVATGGLGGFTTFSAFSYETYQLIAAGKLTLAGAYSLGSVVLGIAALLLGVELARLLA